MADLRTIKMAQWSNKYCKLCGRRMNKWDERCSFAMREPPTCEKCLAKKFDKTIEELNQFLDEWYHIRECQFK